MFSINKLYNDNGTDSNSNRSLLSRKTVKNYSRWSPLERGISLAWRNLSVYVKVRNGGKQKHKRIINDVTGAVMPGNLVALMGSSGAGKSTLMSALAYRSSSGTIIEGDVLVNGRPVGAYMKYLCGYVHQDELFVDSLTVLEHMNIMARLKFDRSVSSSERDKKVRNILKNLGLSNCLNNRIGSIGQNKVLSEGEMKRLAFATELLTDPPILFCDEPTTGLDSYSANTLVKILGTMATTGKTILCTIHQPSSEIFAMFTQVVLLAEGRIAFIGHTSSAITFFESLGYTCPTYYNPADFLIKALAVSSICEENKGLSAKRICDHYVVSDYYKEIEVVVQHELHMGRAYSTKQFHLRENFKELYWWEKLYWLTIRWVINMFRNFTTQILKILQRAIIACIVGFCYFEVEPYTQRGIQAVQGAIFLIVAENTFTPMYSILAEFPENTAVFMREYQSGLYHPGTYYMSRILSLLPGFILEPLCFIFIAYWLAGLRKDAYSFFMTVVITVLTMNTASACGIMFSNAFDSVPSAMAYLVPFDYMLMIISGLFVKLSTLPKVISWAKYLSWLMYATESLSVIQWQGIFNISCNDNLDETIPCVRDGNDVLEKYSFTSDNFSRDIWNMFVLCISFYIIGYFCLWCKIRE